MDSSRAYCSHLCSARSRPATLSDVTQEDTRAAEPAAPRQFTVLLSATRRGARLARLLAVEQLRSWEVPFETAEHIVAELAANAMQHGRVQGRGFRLTLSATSPPASRQMLRIEVADARGERWPATCRQAPPDSESGRGLLLVGALADRWGVNPGPAPCKTVWAELDSPR